MSNPTNTTTRGAKDSPIEPIVVWDLFLQQLQQFYPTRHAREFPRWVWAVKTWSISTFTQGLKNLQ